MPNSPEDKASVLKRVRRIKGQCDGLERALDDGVDCGALLQQIAAVRGAINGLMAEVLETHLRDELVPQNAEADQKVQDLLGLVRTYLK